MNVCKNCSAQFQTGNNFCESCGSLANTGDDTDVPIGCETHPDQHAVGCCVICNKPVCSVCKVMVTGKILCHDPEHRVLLQDWCMIQEPASEFVADALARNLADGGIEAKSFSLHDHIATHWLKENRVLLFVKKSEEEKAQALLQELNLISND